MYRCDELTDPAVSFDGFHESRERVTLQHDSVRVISNEVEIFERGARLGALAARRLPLVSAALQVVFLVIAD